MVGCTIPVAIQRRTCAASSRTAIPTTPFRANACHTGAVAHFPCMAIKHVSDTAQWVAEYRAMETDRPDAIFRDPYARRLAGAEGARIVDSLKQGRALAWPMIV